MGHERGRIMGRRRSNAGDHRPRDDEFSDSEQYPAASEFHPLPGTPLILPREQHSISRRMIDSDALKVMGRLIRHGYRAFLVGGGVRDLLLGKVPKDFDIGTDATPEGIRSLFRNSRFIGRRFRIVHVYFGGNKIFELSTFRKTSEADTVVEGDISQRKNDNTWGDPETDAIRRDLTINGLFYDLATFSVIDYVGGIEDLRGHIIRVIGDPDARFREDPVRMIRAVRHAARTDFTIEPKTYDAIVRNAALISTAAPARVFEELTRELRGGVARASLTMLWQTGLLGYLIPPLASAITQGGESSWELLLQTLDRLDFESRHDPEISLSVIFAALMIGNVPDTFMAGDLSPSSHETMLSLWRPVPILNAEDLEDLEDKSGNEDEEDYEDSRGGRSAPRDRRVAVVVAASSVERLFRAIGVPRRERERIRQILCARAELFRTFRDQQVPRALFGRAYFADVMRVLRLTAHAPIIDDCLTWVEAQLTREPSNRRRRGRRRGPRRE